MESNNKHPVRRKSLKSKAVQHTPSTNRSGTLKIKRNVHDFEDFDNRELKRKASVSQPSRRKKVKSNSEKSSKKFKLKKPVKRCLQVSFLGLVAVVGISFLVTRPENGDSKNPIQKLQKSVSAQTQETLPAVESVAEPVQLVLNEYMTSNHTVFFGEKKKSPDWIELYNAGSQPVSLAGMSLTDSPEEPEKWKFPENASVEAGGYLVILMDEKDDKNGTDSFLHASFKLGTDTNCLMIYKGTETVLNAPLTRTELEFSVGQQGGATVYYTSPTPGQANASDNFQNETEALASLEHSVVVSEACAYQENGSDWVELCNVSQTPVSLNGWSISDKPLGKEEESTYTFGEISLNAGECLLLSSVDENGDGTLPFSLSADGDKIYLYDQEGNMKDFFTVAQAHAGHSCGRDLATGTTLFYDVPTPQQPNGTGYTGYAQLPELSNMGGYAQIGEKITAPMSQDMTIYYTDDGTVPTQESQVFTEYTLNGNQVLRFYVVQAGLLPSEVTAVTYITDAVHDVPIVCLSSDPYGLYSDEEGILVDGGKGDYEFPYRGANFWQDWEREVSFEYYLPDGSRELFCNAGAKVHGQYSRAYPQKSIALYFRSKYNTSEVHYPFFDENNPVTDFSSILLRATGQDHSGARIRDAFVAETAEEYSDLLHMDWQPICVYINGQYQGQYNLREKVSADHIKNHEGIQKENLDLVKDNDEVKSGSREDFSAILRYMEEHDMSTQESYEYVASKIDIDNYIDYLITEIFFANEDGGSNNKHYRDSENGKWRWVLYDVDMSMGMTQDCTEVNGFNTLKDIFSPSGNGAEAFYVSGLQRGLTQNSTYMQKFISRYAELLNTSFMPDKLSARLDEMTAKMDAEMKLHQLSYSPSYEEWKESVEEYREVLLVRRDVCKTEFINYFDLSDEEIATLFPNG